MSENKFKPGDVVRLKSGGPDMTIVDFSSISEESPSYECQWFSGAKLNDGYFPEENLILVTDEEK